MRLYRKTYLVVPGLLLLLLLLSMMIGCTSTSTPTTTTTPATTLTTTLPPKTTTPPPATTTSPTTSPAPITTTKPVSTVELNISAATSLTDAIKAINDAYIKEYKIVKISANFAASGTLQMQIEQGAPADVFISAATKQMDNLQQKVLLLNETRKNLLYNKVVLVVPLDSTLGLTSFNDLALDKVKKLAIGDPKSVPAGDYASQAFDLLGITAKVQPKEILGADVRQVLTYVEGGNVDAGIVYSTDALTSTKVKVVASAPVAINAKVVYPIAVINGSKNPEVAKHYLNFLFSPEAKDIFEKYGFSMATK
jgi:molybdate transport system substrate-binding protein